MNYKEDGNGGFYNMIIAKDGDIELMHITFDRSKTWNNVNVTIDDAVKWWNEL